MKKYIAIALLMVLGTAYPAYARWSVGTAGGGAAAACATQTTVDIATGTNDHTAAVYDENVTVGQDFVASESVTLYSIILSVSSVNSGAESLTLRLGTGADLSSSYAAEVTGVNPSGTGEVEFVFDSGSRPTITSTTTYYIGVRNTAAYANRLELHMNSPSNYANGTYRRSSGDTTWNMATTENSDMYLRYKKCD